MSLGETRDGDGPIEQRLGLPRVADSDGRERDVVWHHRVQGRIDDHADIFFDEDLPDGLQFRRGVRGDERVARHGKQQRA